MSIVGKNLGFQENFAINKVSNYEESNILIPAFPVCSTYSEQNQCSPDKFIGYGAFGMVWSVTDPRTGKRLALKKLSNVFHNWITGVRSFREIKMLNTFKHDNISSAYEFLLPPRIDFFNEIYILMELMDTDLHKIMTSPQVLTVDHIKLFMYQILRGLKYLHSARIMHRDIKPGNLLVNSNCLLKICDFGLARAEEDGSIFMTSEVVTQYYRAPELLMGATYYSSSVDIWSVGCILAEMYSRKILFLSGSPLSQLELITDLLGTPTPEATKYGCPEARAHLLYRTRPKLPSLAALYRTSTPSPSREDQLEDNSVGGEELSPPLTGEAIHLLLRMLVFDPDARIQADQALTHPFLREGRKRFHSTVNKGNRSSSSSTNREAVAPGYHGNSRSGGGHLDWAEEGAAGEALEPTARSIFCTDYEKELRSSKQLRSGLHKYLMDSYDWKNVPLLINTFSPLYHEFKKTASSMSSSP